MAFFFGASLYSCGDAENKSQSNNYFRLRIALDTSANFYLDSIGLSSAHMIKGSDYEEYDSILKQGVYVFDSVEKGNVKLTLVSILDRSFDKNIIIHSDTTIQIRRNELYNFIDIKIKSLTSISLNEGDSIVVGLSSAGCFHFLKENIIINKTGGKYYAAFNSTRGISKGLPPIHLKREFDSSFVKEINNFYIDCKSLLKTAGVCISTTSKILLIRIGNHVYKSPYFGCKDWKGYDNLVNRLDPPWLKKTES